jgi:hypothetical protein
VLFPTSPSRFQRFLKYDYVNVPCITSITSPNSVSDQTPPCRHIALHIYVSIRTCCCSCSKRADGGEQLPCADENDCGQTRSCCAVVEEMSVTTARPPIRRVPKLPRGRPSCTLRQRRLMFPLLTSAGCRHTAPGDAKLD